MSDDLRNAIARYEPADDAAPGSLPVVAAFGPPDQVQILKILGLDPADARAHAVVAVAERYGLDPVLGEIMILPKSSRPYVSRDGYLQIAHRSRQLDGIEVVDGPRRDPQEREWVASVAVYRKDMTRPFIFPGRASMNLDNGPEMAITRAERRALRRAFAVTLPDAFAEDEYDTRPAAPAPPPVQGPDGGTSPAAAPAPPPDAEPIRKNTLKALQAALREAGFTAAQRTARLQLLSDMTGRTISSANNLTEDEAAAILTRLADRARDAAGNGRAASSEPDGDPPAEPPPAEAVALATKTQRNELLTLLRDAGITDRAEVLARLTEWAGHPVERTSDLTEEQARVLIGHARALPANAAGEDTDAGDDPAPEQA